MDTSTSVYHLLPRLSLQQVLDQRFGEEYRLQEPSTSSTPPPPLPPHPFGSVGDGRLQRGRQEEGQVAVQLRQPIFEARRRRQERHHHHHHHPAAPAPAPQAPAPMFVPIWWAAPHRNRPLCCSFCFGTATQMAGEVGLPLPERDDVGVWSTHSCKEGGIVTCPFLWQVTCPLCGATGAVAHTRAEHIRMEGQRN